MQAIAFNLPDRPSNFKPYRSYKSFILIPTCLVPELSSSACVLYGFLCKHAGKSDHCCPGQDVLAREMRLSVSQIRNLTNELVDSGLIRVKQRGLRKTNVYYFPMNPEVEDEPPEQPPESFQWKWRGNVAHLWAKTAEREPETESSETETQAEPEPVETGTPSETPTPGIDIDDIISVISEEHREPCRPVIEKFLQSHEPEYVRLGVKYSKETFRKDKKIPFEKFLELVLSKNWHKDWEDASEKTLKIQKQISRRNDANFDEYHQHHNEGEKKYRRKEAYFEGLSDSEKERVVSEYVDQLSKSEKGGDKFTFKRYARAKESRNPAERMKAFDLIRIKLILSLPDSGSSA